MPPRPALGCALALVLAAAPRAGAEAPLSAIDWLSRSVAAAPVPPGPPPPAGAPVDDVTVHPLDALARDGTGVIDAAEAGVPRGFWGATPAAALAALIAAERLETVPALRALFETLLLARLDPPQDAGREAAFLLARIDKLLDMGALAAADALIAAVETPGTAAAALFRRRFDIALLTGTEDAACADLRRTPGIAPTFPARIFCLARGGDWPAAALALDTARALGTVAPEEDALLARFLDLENADEAAPPTPPAQPSPLALRLFEAIGEPIPTAGLPLAFAHADLRITMGWKGRIEAGERLARAGALPAEALFALYAERRPAASGGVWDRVRAAQALAAALETGDPAAVAPALLGAWAAMQAAEIELPLAVQHGAAVAGLPLSGPAAGVAFRLALLAGAAADPPPDDTEAAFLAALARGDTAGRTAPGSLGRTIAPVFEGPPARLVPARLAALIDGDRQGEAALRALSLIAEGATGDRRRVTEGLAVLRALGFEAAARAAAVQLLVLDRRG